MAHHDLPGYSKIQLKGGQMEWLWFLFAVIGAVALICLPQIIWPPRDPM